MKMQLPEPLHSYYAATNARDADAMIALFAADGVVKDEAAEHHGRDAIRDWIAGITRKYGAISVEPIDIGESADASVVTSVVSGDFNGSPATLRYTFVLADKTIKRLEIT